MRLTRFTDLALRLLIELASAPGRRTTIGDVAQAHGVSRFHLMKVANLLSRHGLLRPVRGRMGGLSLARPAAEIGLGEVLRLTEPEAAPPDCTGCPLQPACGLPSILEKARCAYFAEIDRHALSDLVPPPGATDVDTP